VPLRIVAEKGDFSRSGYR